MPRNPSAKGLAPLTFIAPFALGLACTNPPATKVPVSVMVLGSNTLRALVRSALEKSPVGGIELRFAEPPSKTQVAPQPGNVAEKLAMAREAYVNANAPECSAAIGDETLLANLLEQRKRESAARVMFWRVACRVVDGLREDAEREANMMASLGLDVPMDADAASPEVESIIGKAFTSAATSAPVPLKVASNRIAEVFVDGNSAACSTPCTINVRPGVHFITVASDGLVSMTRRATVPNEKEITFAPSIAPPQLAGEQWASSFAEKPAVESAKSIALLAQSVEARNFALLFLDVDGTVGRFRGAFSINQNVPIRAERSFSEVSAAPALAPPLLSELLLNAKVIESTPLVKNVWFWASVIATAAITVSVSYVVLVPPDVRTQVRF